MSSSKKHAQDFKDAILDIIFVSVRFSNSPMFRLSIDRLRKSFGRG